MDTKARAKIGKAAAAAAAFLCGCVQPYVLIDKVVTPPFDHTFIRTVAVTEFTNRSPRYDAGRTVADRIEGLLVNESPYKVVPRQVLEERGLARGSRIDSRTTERIGRVAGVNAVVLGTVEVYEFQEVKLRKSGITDLVRGARVARKASVVLYVKLVNAKTGQVVWSKRASGEVSWTGWKDPGSGPMDTRYLEKALDQAVAEVRAIFSHKEKVREPAS